MNNEKTKGIIITIIGAGCWGLSGCIGQFLFTEKNISATWLVTIRLVLAGLILVLIGFSNKKMEMIEVFKNPKDFRNLIYFSFFGMLLSQLTYFLAIEHSNAGTATVLQSLSTVMILVYICLKQLRIPKKVELLALVIASIGAFLLATSGNIRTLSLSSYALFYGLLSAVGAMLYSLISIDLMKKYGVFVTVGFSMLISGFCLMFITKPWTYNVAFDIEMILGILGVIIIGTVIAYSFFLKGISMIGSFTGSLIGNIEPVTAVIVSVAFLGSSFTIIELFGIVLILSAVIILTQYYKQL